MPIQVFGQGATQTAYVSYVNLDIEDRDPDFPEQLGSVNLLWPTSYVDAPYFDDVNEIQYEIIAASMDIFTGNDNENTLTLPNATETSIGSNSIIRNIGSSNFNILDFDGNPVQIAEPGIAYWLLLINNLTAAGDWQVITFGAGTSQASAAALAGFGLRASLDNKLNTWVKVFDEAAVPVIDETFSGSIVVWKGDTKNILLPDVDTVPDGYYLSFNNQGTGIITLVPFAGTIDNKPNLPIDITQSLTVISDGTNWWTLGFGLGKTIPFNAISKTVSGGVNVFLTPEDSLNDSITFEGTITANIIVGINFKQKTWILTNNATGNFTLTVQLADNDHILFGNQFVIPPLTSQIFYHDNSNFYSYPTSLNSLTINGGNLNVNNHNININTGQLNIDAGNININNGRSLFPNGTRTLPAYSFTGFPDSGIYHATAGDEIRVSLGDTLAANFKKQGTISGIAVISPAGKELQLNSSDTPDIGVIAYNAIQAIKIDAAGIVTLTFPLPINSGGTNAITQPAAVNNIMPPAATKGTFAYYDTTALPNPTWVILAPPAVGGAADAYLKITKATGVPFWSDT